MIIRALATGLLFFATLHIAAARDPLYSIGATGGNQPARVVSINPNGTVTTLFDLNSENLGFSGLTYNPSQNLFYAVANDSSGGSSLVSFSPSGGGAFTTIMPLNNASPLDQLSFNGGLVYDPQDGFFYGMANSSIGDSFLFQIDSVHKTVIQLTERIPGTFNGGLTLDSNGVLFGLLTDSDYNTILYQFDPTNPNIVTQVGTDPLGYGFVGGLVWDDGVLYALGNDLFGNSSLNSITGGTVGYISDVGVGFYNAGLTLGPGVPEPATWTLLLSGCGLGLAALWRRRKP